MTSTSHRPRSNISKGERQRLIMPVVFLQRTLRSLFEHARSQSPPFSEARCVLDVVFDGVCENSGAARCVDATLVANGAKQASFGEREAHWDRTRKLIRARSPVNTAAQIYSSLSHGPL